MSRLYPLYHDLRNRHAIVVGGGVVASRRVPRLLEAGARVTVIAPAATPAIAELAAQGRIEWERRRWTSRDADDADLVLEATGDLDVAKQVRSAAKRIGVPCNSATDQQLCDFHIPACTDRGAVRVAIGSGGSSPALSAQLRREIECWLATRGDTDRPQALPARPGVVYLVGAGPGDPGLLTARAVALLAAADVVYHDRLVSDAVLRTIPERAERVYVGKEVGCAHRANIARLLIDSARAGRVVVRLKGGDPILFGRGGEEVLALRAADVEYEIVPGVSAVCAVPAAADIPVTYRGVASEVVIRSGHKMREVTIGAADDSDESSDPTDRCETTFVYFMAVSRLDRVVDDLRREGIDDSTPIAVVQDGTLPSQRVVTGTLASIAEVVRRESIAPPALVVAGDVVSFLSDPAAFAAAIPRSDRAKHREPS